MDQKQNGTWYENPGGVVQSNEWYTPPEIFTAQKVNFDLDEAIKILIKNSISKKDISKALALVTDYSVNDLYKKIKDL